MIHYRLINGDIYSAKIYRSFVQARKDARKTGSNIIAFANKQAALEMSDIHLSIGLNDDEPALISNETIINYVRSCDEARELKNYDRRASDRARIESMYDLSLFGFDHQGRAIESKQYMSVSRKWVRFSAPIYINGKKVTKKTLLKGIQYEQKETQTTKRAN